ncbi:hypothetical protein QAD02_007235 [Eretmocerus hayati]|uniref:Uncharacterized protein n=1 Tax=Eretmocerus hayati TaxID=131215 RepID=A0ACC2N348_9HYME|nr:hypothetical protein QAD02_007235 [Eretmocerus hayati]
MCRASSALLPYGMSERYRGSINSKNVGSHSSGSLVSAILWDSPARTATSDDDRPVKDRNASSDPEQITTVKYQKGRQELFCIDRWSLTQDHMIENQFHGQGGGQSYSTISRVPKALLLYGLSERYRGINNPKNFWGHT